MGLAAHELFSGLIRLFFLVAGAQPIAGYSSPDSEVQGQEMAYLMEGQQLPGNGPATAIRPIFPVPTSASFHQRSDSTSS
jgi:hypothetical protein